MEKKQIPDSLESISKACDEAEDLLAALDESDHKQKKVEEKKSIPIEQSNTSITESKTKNEGAGGCLTILGIGTVIMVIAAATNQGEIGSYATQQEYREAMQLAEEAVLISEHQHAIKQLNTLKTKGINPNTMDNGLLNNKIIQANKAILFLDQKGKKDYWENSEYGYQWFDKHDKNAFKVFFAHSRKCKNPMITFRHQADEYGPMVKLTSIQPISNISTIRVPFALSGREEWIGINEFQCN